MKRLFLILVLLTAAFPASASVMQIRDASGTVTDVTSANPLPVDAAVSIGSLTVATDFSGRPSGTATDPVNVSGALSFTASIGSATDPATILATQSRVVSGSFQPLSATSTSVLPTLFPLASPTMPATVVVTCNVGECWLGATGLTATGSIVASQGFKLQAGQSVSYDYFTGFDLTVCADTDETANASVTTAIYPRK